MATYFHHIFQPDQLISLAGRFGTPLYVYDEKRIREKCRKAKSAFPDLPVEWLYAVKANDNPWILQIFSDERFGFDTVSYEEVLLGLHFQDDPQKILYTENNMTDAEMHAAVSSGVMLNIGSYSRLEAFCRAYPGSGCCIRVNPAIGDGHHHKVVTGNRESKFGIRLDLLEACRSVAQKYDVRIEGLHMHIGSGIKKPKNLINAIRVMLRLSEKIPGLSFINFGGGLPVPYAKNDIEFDMDFFAEGARPLLEEDLKSRPEGFRYLFEPGRWLTADAGVLLARVNTVKDQGNVEFIGVDTGLNHLLRPTLYESYHEIINISRSGEVPVQTYTIAGNICESGDLLGEGRLLPRTEAGDVLAIADSGAYGMTMASHYNRRALPAEVLIRENGDAELIREREKPEEIVNRHLAETAYRKPEKA